MSNVKPQREVYLKVAMNKEKTKVMFAEANNEFVDVLLSFLALPLGKMVTNIKKKREGSGAADLEVVVGSLNSLYAGLSDLDDSYFSWQGAKQMMLNPRSSSGVECRKLALDITDSPKKYYTCEGCRVPSFSMYYPVVTCSKCGKPLDLELPVKESPGAGGFTTDPSFFIVTDHLCVAPIVGGVFQTLNNLGYSDTDTQGVEMKTLNNFGIDEIRDLLKLALTSATPLTDMVIKKIHASATPKAELSSPWYHHLPKEKAHSRKIALKVSLQKSTNKFLFAEATSEFVELLFSFLSVSLGGVEFLLGGNTALKNIDNIYRSVTYGIDNKYFKTRKSKEMLINPKLPFGYISKNQFLPLSEEAPTTRLRTYSTGGNYYFHDQEPRDLFDKLAYFLSMTSGSIKLHKDLYVKKLYLKKEAVMYTVSDDLSVSPGLATTISIINTLGIPLSDLKQMVVPIGLEEALTLLKASLTSKTAITDGLISPMLNKLRN